MTVVWFKPLKIKDIRNFQQFQEKLISISLIYDLTRFSIVHSLTIIVIRTIFRIIRGKIEDLFHLEFVKQMIFIITELIL
jgi:hypothetical protein